MALDGLAISSITNELKTKLLGGRIDKIYQPEKDEIIINIRSLGENYKLLLSCNPSNPRLSLTNQFFENPMTPPLFCSLLRKYITNSKLTEIVQPNFERIVILSFVTKNELGDFVTLKIVIEIMGKHSNIIFINEENRILDGMKRVSFDTSSVREVLPGKEYSLPPNQHKFDPILLEKLSFLSNLENKKTEIIQNFIYKTYSGISPIINLEICARANIDQGICCGDLVLQQTNDVFDDFNNVVSSIKSGEFVNKIYYKEGKLFDFSAIDLLIYENLESETFDSISELLDVFYKKKDTDRKMGQKFFDIKKIISNGIERCIKKMDIQNKTLKKIENREIHKLYGELITTFAHSVEKKSEQLVCENYYDENKLITIALNKDKSPIENAQRYYKLYNKEKRTFDAIKIQIVSNNAELKYLESVMESLNNCSTEDDINEIRQELFACGLIKSKSKTREKSVKSKSKPMKYTSSEGFIIYVGKNNKQNDEITMKLASNHDMWLHVKELAGSHVIIKSNLGEFTEKVIQEAANLAAIYSKGKNGSNVPIDYVLKKMVKKPSGAKPGMVIYENHKTIYVTPDEKLVHVE